MRTYPGSGRESAHFWAEHEIFKSVTQPKMHINIVRRTTSLLTLLRSPWRGSEVGGNMDSVNVTPIFRGHHEAQKDVLYN